MQPVVISYEELNMVKREVLPKQLLSNDGIPDGSPNDGLQRDVEEFYEQLKDAPVDWGARVWIGSNYGESKISTVHRLLTALGEKNGDLVRSVKVGTTFYYALQSQLKPEQLELE